MFPTIDVCLKCFVAVRTHKRPFITMCDQVPLHAALCGEFSVTHWTTVRSCIIMCMQVWFEDAIGREPPENGLDWWKNYFLYFSVSESINKLLNRFLEILNVRFLTCRTSCICTGVHPYVCDNAVLNGWFSWTLHDRPSIYAVAPRRRFRTSVFASALVLR